PPFFGRLDGLGIDHCRRGRGRFARQATDILAQALVNADPSAIVAEAIIIMPRGVPVGQIVGKRSPGAAIAQQVVDAVEHLTQVRLAWPPAGFGRRNHRLDQLPLLVGQIGRISFSLHPTAYAGPYPNLQRSQQDFLNTFLGRKIFLRDLLQYSRSLRGLNHATWNWSQRLIVLLRLTQWD